MHKELPDDGKKGLCCLECKSVFFSIESLLQHLNDRPGHRMFRSGDNLVVSIDYLRDVDEAAVGHYEYLQSQESADDE